MLKKVFRTLSLPIILLSLIVCSRLDPYTSTGAGIVNSIDPALTDFDGTFFAYSADESIVQDSFTTPAAGQFRLKKVDDSLVAGFTDTIISIAKIITGITIGDSTWNLRLTIKNIQGNDTGFDTLKTVSGSHENSIKFDTLRQVIQAAGNVKFGASVQHLEKFQPTDIVTAVTIIFENIIFDSIHFGERYRDPDYLLKLYSCAREFQANPFVQRTSGTTLLGTPIALTDTTDTSLNYQLTLTDSSFLTTIQIACSSFATCRGDTARSDSAITTNCALPDTFYFSLFNNDLGGLLRFKGARMVISHKRATSTSNDAMVYLSTINGKISTVYSKHPRRTTVFKLNLAPLWESMSKNNFSEILSAAFVIPGKISFSESDSDSVALLQYYLSDIAYDADTALDSRIDAATDLYRTGLNINGRAVDSLILPVDFFLQKIAAGKPSSAYLYLQTFSKFGNWQDINLKKPRFRAVFTTIR